MGALKALRLPRLGETMEEGTIVAWLKQPGERFRRGEILLEIETDKTVVEVPALEDGLLVEQLQAAQDTVEVGAPIATVETEGAAVADVGPPPGAAAVPEAARPTPVAPPAAPRQVSGERTLATPAARRLARGGALPLEGIEATGRRGRIVRADVERALAAAAPAVRTVDERDGPVATRHGDLFVKRWLPSGRPRPATVVLLHGLFGDVETWSITARALCRAGVPVAALDLPNHGRSASDAVGLEDIVVALEEAITATLRGPLILLGHSFGALAALRLAARDGLDVRSVTLLAPAGLGAEINQDFIDAMTGAETTAQLRPALDQLWPGGTALQSPLVLETLLARIAARRPGLTALIDQLARDGAQLVDLRAELAALAVPTRILHGRDDLIVPWRHALNAPPTTALHLIPDCGHMPHWQAPQTVERILLAAP